MSRNIRYSKEGDKKLDIDFLQEHIKRLMQVTETRWLARTLECSPALVYQWINPKPRSLPTPIHLWKISSVESFLFGLEEEENYEKWMKACGYDIKDDLIKAHLKWLEMEGQEMTVKFPSLKLVSKEKVGK